MNTIYDYNTLSFDQFIRSVEISKNETFSILLGAGASISSGIQSANDCIWEWKKDIYLSNNVNAPSWIQNHKLDQVRIALQKWLDGEGAYIPLEDPNEYSFYVEKCYPIEDDRRKYFQRLCARIEPSVGYYILCLLAEAGIVQSVWTTNFDNLTIKGGTLTNVPVVDISLDTVARIMRPENNKELLHISLHGDYRYGALKNTSKELLKQDELFRNKLIDYLNDKHLIVIGYSGRDNSLMEALQLSYSKPGSGRLYWCGFGESISPEVADLLQLAKDSGRSAYYISTDGFDKLMLKLGKSCLKDSTQLLDKFHKYSQGLTREFETTPFSIPFNHINQIIKSNSFQIKLPKEVYYFEMLFKDEEGRWSTIRELTKNRNVKAVPYKGMIWALGTLTDIQNCFSERIIGKISRKPLADIHLWKDTAIYNLLIGALTTSLAVLAKHESNGKNLIWSTQSSKQKRYNNIIYSVHQAIRLFFNFDSNYYLTLVPDFYVSSELDEKVSKEIKQDIGREYFEKLWNKKFNDYVNDWRKSLFISESNKQVIEFPIDSGTGFTFEIFKTPSFAKIMKAGTQYGITLNSKFPIPAIKYHGIQYSEPDLLFTSKHKGATSLIKDFHPMRGLVANRPYDYNLTGTILDSEVRMGIICPRLDAPSFSNFIKKQFNRISSNNINQDYLIDFPGYVDGFGLSINIPEIQSNRWVESPEPIQHASLEETSRELANSLRNNIDELTKDGKNIVVVIFIPDRWNSLLNYDLDGEAFDLHDYIKAYCAEKRIATQFIQEDTINNSLECQIHWSLALSFYVKAFRTPWILETIDKTTAFAGIGYSIDRKAHDNHIVLGCSHIYNSQGEGLKYKLSKIEDELFWDRQKNPHLSYNDSFQFGLSIRELFFAAMNELPKRVVIHKRTYYTQDEINGIKDSLLGNGVEKVDLIEINFEDSIKYIASKINREGMPDEADSFSIPRGTCILQTSNSALLWSHGIVPSVRNINYKYYLGGRYIPEPLKVIKHFGDGNIGQIANEILGLSKMNWNSFNLYAQLPATISSSNQIARIGKLLTKRDGASYDYRYFI